MPADMNSLLVFLAVGFIAGYLAGLIVEDDSFGAIGNAIVGVVGAAVGTILFRELGFAIPPGIGGQIVVAAVGAVVLLLVIGVIRA